MGFGDHAHMYHSMGSHHFGRNICNCLCFVFCIGPILFLIGLGLIVSSFTDVRGDHINNYNAAVDTWVSPNVYANYANTKQLSNMSMRFVNLAQSAQLANTTSSETYFHDNDERIRTYTEFIRFTTGFALDVTSRCSNGAPWYGCDISNFLSFDLLSNGTLIRSFDVPAFSRTRVQSRESACPDGSYWDSVSHNCDTYSIVTSICVKLSQNAAGWEVDYGHGVPGCGQKSWNVAAFEHIRISPTSLPTVVYLDLTVRSALDPRVVFYWEMGIGATDFGLTRGAKFGVGITFLTLGSLVLLCCVGTCMRLLRLNKHHRTYDEVRTPHMVYAQQPVYVQQPAVVYAQPVYGQPYPPNQQPQYQQQPPYPQQGYQQTYQ